MDYFGDPRAAQGRNEAARTRIDGNCKEIQEFVANNLWQIVQGQEETAVTVKDER